MFNKEIEIKESIINATKRWIEEESTPKDDFYKRIVAESEGDVVLIGMRRLGKTEYLKFRYTKMFSKNKNNESSNDFAISEIAEEERLKTIFINFDDPIFSTVDFETIESESFRLISKSIEKIIEEEDIQLILIDEIQRRVNWTRWLKGMKDKYKNITFVATGSDASTMVDTTEFGGTRFKIIYMGFYSFYEYSQKEKNNPNYSFIDYVENNYFPDTIFSKDLIDQYNNTIEKQSITKKISRKNINLVLKYIALNPGIKLTPGKITEKLKELNPDLKIPDNKQTNTILNFLLESQLIFTIENRYTKVRLKTKEEYRYYCTNFNSYLYYSFDKYSALLLAGIPRRGLVFENIIISNVYTFATNNLERSKVMYYDDGKKDCDLVINENYIEIKSFDINESSEKKKILEKISKFENPIIIHTGQTFKEKGINIINYEEFLKEQKWLKIKI